jgi:two-component sensor histidine kinase
MLLVHEIVRIFSANTTVKAETIIDDFMIPMETLFPLGIIINEIITNSMKYAFPNRNDGIITVLAEKKGNHVEFIIADNGIGIPDSMDIENPGGFGLQLVCMLMEQIDGVVKIERDHGAKFILEFDV